MHTFTTYYFLDLLKSCTLAAELAHHQHDTANISEPQLAADRPQLTWPQGHFKHQLVHTY